jgi:universal stress protein A
MPNLKKILVAIDFSPASRTALDYALLIARPFGAAVELLNVLQASVTAPEPAIARQHMQDLVDALRASGVEQLASTLEPGSPAETILARASAGAFDLIVMGTHGSSGLEHLVFGSVAERVVRAAACPVLTVRAAP